MLQNKSTHEKKKSELRFDVGNGCVLGGVVLLGGGLVVAGLVAAFTFIKSRNNARDNQKNQDPSAAAPEKIHDGTQGLGSVLKNPTAAVHQNSCGANHATPTIGVTSSHNVDGLNNLLHQDDKPVPTTTDGEGETDDVPSGYQQEILLSSDDDLNKESIEPCNEILINEETSLPMLDIIVKNDTGENLQLMEKIEMNKEVEPTVTEKLEPEDNSSMQSEEAEEEEEEEEEDDGRSEQVVDKVEVSPEGEITPKVNLTPIQPVEEGKEDEKESSEDDEILPIQPVEEEGGGDKKDDDDDDVYDDKHANDDSSEEDVTEKEEGSSEGTGSSSRESNVEAIWPTDMIEALSHELKVINANNENSVEKMAKTECDYLNSKSEHRSKNETTENELILNKETPQESIFAKVETIHLPTREVCVWSLLALTLLLLLLHIHHTSLRQDLSYEN